MTRSLSNVIKAYNIKYTEEKKQIDSNDKAGKFQQLYIDNFPKLTQIENISEYGLEEQYFDESNVSMLQEDSNLDNFIEDSKEQIRMKDEFEQEVLERRFHMEKEAEDMIVEATNKAKDIIATAKTEAEKEKKRIRQEAETEGYQEGIRKAEKEVAAAKAEITEQLKKNELNFEKQVEELEPAFVEIVIALLKKLTGVMIEERRDLILHVIHQSMLGIENSKNFIIRISKDDYDFVNSKKEDILFDLQGATVEIIIDPILQRAQCTIETDTRILDCSLDVQLRNLIADLKLLAGIQ